LLSGISIAGRGNYNYGMHPAVLDLKDLDIFAAAHPTTANEAIAAYLSS
jgi:hypothetical protein